MSRDPNGPRHHAADFQMPQTAEDALIAWDELDAQLLQMLAEDPERGRRLRKLQDADSWLRARAAETARRKHGPAILECPPAEELYDFGQGPGATTLSQARQDAIDRHLATCRECETYVETLIQAPPPPLFVGLPAEEETPAEPAWTRPTPVIPMRRKGPQRLLVGAGLAAAAALVVMVGIRSLAPAPLEFPKQPILRGSAGGPILYPRGHVLLPSDELKAVFPALGGPIAWQIEPQTDATEYKLTFIRHDGSAFAKQIDSQSVSTPQASGALNKPLEEGHYTLSAFVIVNGLNQRLPSRDFDVVRDAALEQQLLALKSQPEPKRTLDAIKLLDAQRFTNDARNLARTLPPSAEREDYLRQIPGR